MRAALLLIVLVSCAGSRSPATTTENKAPATVQLITKDGNTISVTVEIADTPQVRGMLTSVHYLLEITPVAGTLQKKANPMRAKRRELKAKAKKG